MNSKHFIRISDWDQPIYRIYPIWFLEEAVRLRQLVLVAPELWEDPFELIGQAIAVDQSVEGRIQQTIINQFLPTPFAQAWSRTADSDTLLRAYSRVVKDPHFKRNIVPRDEGVRVRSTPRKLLQALLKGLPKTFDGNCFIGSVQYWEQERMLQDIANGLQMYGATMFEKTENRAQLLLMKRQAYEHEAEVRLLLVPSKPEHAGETFQIPFDPNAVFDEISFDPRLEAFERLEREKIIASVGYTGQFRTSLLYRRVLLQVALK